LTSVGLVRKYRSRDEDICRKDIRGSSLPFAY
jgi:hypothetical protein